jgi:charged multivesicular body protein 4
MMNWFGSKKEKPTTSTVSSTSASRPADPQETIVKLRENIANQEKREEHIGRKVEAMIVEAKAKMGKGDKKGALFAMKRKKLYEAEIDKIQNVKMTLETQVMNLESAAQNAETFRAMEAGSKTMKKIREQVGIEDVDDIMDNIQEEMQMANEINAAIATPVDPLVTDEDELLAELAELEAGDLEAELLAPPTKQFESLELPSVPDSKLPTLAKKEEEDLRALEAELAGL